MKNLFFNIINFFKTDKEKIVEKYEAINATPIDEEQQKVLLLKKIADCIFTYGKRFGKKHGNWILLKLDREFFYMDSWNGAVYFSYGEPIYEYWLGFESDNPQTSLGLSNNEWRGSDKLKFSLEDYERFFEKLKDFSLQEKASNENIP